MGINAKFGMALGGLVRGIPIQHRLFQGGAAVTNANTHFDVIALVSEAGQTAG